jgi:hypothetical protein
VDCARPTSAEMTAAIVLDAARTGASLCIPGAREARVARPAGRTAVGPVSGPPAEADARTAAHRERLEYELAGGGAASERGSTRRASVIERLCHLLRRPSRRHEEVAAEGRPHTEPLTSLPVIPR